jgi:hypothetical protein
MRRNDWRVKFAHNGKDISSDERNWLARWWATLQEETRRKVAAKEPILSISSYADTTGKVDLNDQFADVRQAKVKDALLRAVGVDVVWAGLRREGEVRGGGVATDERKREARESGLRMSVLSVEEPIVTTVLTPEALQVRQEGARRRAEEEEAIQRQVKRNEQPGSLPRP